MQAILLLNDKVTGKSSEKERIETTSYCVEASSINFFKGIQELLKQSQPNMRCNCACV